MPFDLLWKFVDVCYIHILKDPVPFCSVNRTFLFQKFELTKFECFRFCFLQKRWYRTLAFEILSSERKSQKWRVGGNLTSCWVFVELEIKFFFNRQTTTTTIIAISGNRGRKQSERFWIKFVSFSKKTERKKRKKRGDKNTVWSHH